MIDNTSRPGPATGHPCIVWLEAPPVAPTRGETPPRRPVSGRWFAAAVALQLLALAWLPADKLAAASTGQTVYLPAASVDPVDLLRGRYVALGYAFEEPGALDAVPGYAALSREEGGTVFLTLAPAAGPARPGEPLPWQPVAVAATPPARLVEGQVVLQARVQGASVRLGLDRYFIPDARGESVQRAIAHAQERTVAAAQVDGAGRAVLTGLHVAGRAY